MNPRRPVAIMRRLAFLAACAVLSGCASMQGLDEVHRASLILFDQARDRSVPIELYPPGDSSSCTSAQPCPVAIISSGYGISASGYTFISSALSDAGYLTVAVQHELPSDPPLSTQGDLFDGRTPVWIRGAENLRFVLAAMRSSRLAFDWDRPVLIGHSNGGDISAWLVRETPLFAGTLITLDNRRVPLPRGTSSPRTLSIRASDFQADPGVLPSMDDLKRSASCVVNIDGARHNDMHDGGPVDLQAAIAGYIARFLDGGGCSDSA